LKENRCKNQQISNHYALPFLTFMAYGDHKQLILRRHRNSNNSILQHHEFY